MKKVAEVFQDYVRSSEHKPFDPLTHKGVWRQLTIRTSSHDDVLITVVIHPQDFSEEDIGNLKQGIIDYSKDGAGMSAGVTSIFFQAFGQRAAVVDLFPHTPHYELLILFERWEERKWRRIMEGNPLPRDEDYFKRLPAKPEGEYQAGSSEDNLHRKKCPSNEILKRFPLFNWEQFKTDFHLYDDFFKPQLKTYINDAHDIIRRDFSWSRCCLILSDQLLAELKGRLQTKVPKLLALLQQVFPNTALDKLAMDQDHCRRLLKHGVGAYSVLIKSLRNVDGKAKFTRESVEAVVRSLTLKRLPSSTTIDDSNAAKTILSESSSTPDFLWAENMKGRGPAHTPPSPRVTRSRSRSSSLGCRPKTSVGVSFPDTSKEESEFPKVVIKRNYVYVSGVEWPNGESKLDLSVKCDNKSSTVNKARSVSSRKMTLRSDGESKLDLSVKCDNESSTVNKARSVSSRKMTLRSDGESKLDLSVKCDNESSTVNKARSVSSRKMTLRSGKGQTFYKEKINRQPIILMELTRLAKRQMMILMEI
ncbi:uncharacterized protein [Palaemon carinicauda]|uniref:uncharacterized protein n=1 Tax=Palaemon carinicauda TaxID=392227 RepID=UPI0035B591B3